MAFFLEGERMTTLLVIDNYDSFTYNLVQMFKQFALSIRVFRSDKITLDQVKKLDPAYILVSPGPKDPSQAGISIELIKNFYQHIPILGVCLGMQCINEVFQGKTIQAKIPMHGKTSQVEHNKHGIFQGLQSPFQAARYHSLVVKPDNQAILTDLSITARSQDNAIMGLSHKKYPLHGVQFHPESFLTKQGFLLVENFLKLGPLTNPIQHIDRTIL